jgi:hypothetical protein
MDNGVIIVPPRDFEHPSRWQYQSHEIKRHQFGAVCNGITPMPNFSKIRPDILVIKCMQTNITGDDVIRSVKRMRRGSWVMTSSASHLTTLSIHHVGSAEDRKLKRLNSE